MEDDDFINAVGGFLQFTSGGVVGGPRVAFVGMAGKDVDRHRLVGVCLVIVVAIDCADLEEGGDDVVGLPQDRMGCRISHDGLGFGVQQDPGLEVVPGGALVLEFIRGLGRVDEVVGDGVDRKTGRHR